MSIVHSRYLIHISSSMIPTKNIILYHICLHTACYYFKQSNNEIGSKQNPPLQDKQINKVSISWSHLLRLCCKESETVPHCLPLGLGRSVLMSRQCSWRGGDASTTSAIVLPLSRGNIWQRVARTGSLLWNHCRWLATHLSKRTMPPLTMLLKGLRFHHLPTVAAHYQIHLIMCWAMAIYVHICREEYNME